MTEYYGAPRSGASLTHHGIKGQKWGVRRYQNEDGTLTKAGLRRQARLEKKELKRDRANVTKTLYSTFTTQQYAIRQGMKDDRIKRRAQKAENKGNMRKAEKLVNRHNRLVEKVDAKVNPIMERNVKTLRDVSVKRGKEQADRWLREAAVKLSYDDIYMNGYYARVFNKKRYAKYTQTSDMLRKWRDRGD